MWPIRHRPARLPTAWRSLRRCWAPSPADQALSRPPDALDSPGAMLAVPGAALCFALARLVGLRWSSLPGFTRSPTSLAPGTSPAGRHLIRPEARTATAIGALTLGGTLLNGVLFGTVALLDLWRAADDPPTQERHAERREHHAGHGCYDERPEREVAICWIDFVTIRRRDPLEAGTVDLAALDRRYAARRLCGANRFFAAPVEETPQRSRRNSIAPR